MLLNNIREIFSFYYMPASIIIELGTLQWKFSADLIASYLQYTVLYILHNFF